MLRAPIDSRDGEDLFWCEGVVASEVGDGEDTDVEFGGSGDGVVLDGGEDADPVFGGLEGWEVETEDCADLGSK